MNMICNVKECTGCSACAQICPQNCINMVEDQEGFLRPVVDTKQCIDCLTCEKICPVVHEPHNFSESVKALAAINPNEKDRTGSTSGGIFISLARWIIEHDGVVFGAAYDEDFNVRHECVTDLSNLPNLQTAKYSQSTLSNTFSAVKRYLLEDRLVMFSGTPCQVAGLRAFLKKDYDRLYLIDLVCHGVPSPEVWKYYLGYRAQKDANGLSIEAVNFRSKVSGWPEYSVEIFYENGANYKCLAKKDPYMKGFVGNLCLRPSCYNCHFKGIHRQSDFTLGDYWGVWSQLPSFNDGKGTSIVLLHSDKAAKLWSLIANNLIVKEVNYQSCMEENMSALIASPMPQERIEFMTEYKNQDFSELIFRLLPEKEQKVRNNIFLDKLRIVKKQLFGRKK